MERWLVLLSNREGQGRVALPRKRRQVLLNDFTYRKVRSAHLQKRVVSGFSLKCQRCLGTVPGRLPLRYRHRDYILRESLLQTGEASYRIRGLTL